MEHSSAQPTADSSQMNTLIQWLELEVKGRLSTVERRLDELYEAHQLLLAEKEKKANKATAAQKAASKGASPKVQPTVCEAWQVPTSSELPEAHPEASPRLGPSAPPALGGLTLSLEALLDSEQAPQSCGVEKLLVEPLDAQPSQSEPTSPEGRFNRQTSNESGTAPVSPSRRSEGPAGHYAKQMSAGTAGSMSKGLTKYLEERRLSRDTRDQAPSENTPGGSRRKSWASMPSFIAGVLDMSHRQALPNTIAMKTSGRNIVRDTIWQHLDDADDSLAAVLYTWITTPIVIASIVLAMLQSLEEPPLSSYALSMIAIAFEAFFAFELLVRFSVCPNRRRFLFSAYNIIDILTVVPLALRAAIGWVLLNEDNRTVIGWLLTCIVPLIRTFKVLRRFQTFELCLDAFLNVLEALPLLIYVYFIIALTFASLLVIAEPPEVIADLPVSMYFTIICMHSAGFAPAVTTFGQFVVVFTCLAGLLAAAMPVGILGAAFTDSWTNRHKVLLIRKTRQRLDEYGFEAEDIPKLFQYCDLDNDGELNLTDFLSMINEMNLGFSEERAIELFRNIDEDKSNTICQKEFVKNIFPTDFDVIFSGAPKRTSWLQATVTASLGQCGVRE